MPKQTNKIVGCCDRMGGIIALYVYNCVIVNLHEYMGIILGLYVRFIVWSWLIYVFLLFDCSALIPKL